MEEIEMQPKQVQFREIEKSAELAVCIRNAYKTYGSKSNMHVVLDGLNMTVPKGTIYGLLGASGCGKTTLLGCMIGRKVFNSGDIWVLGGTPGSRSSGSPGPRLGYMPQETALYEEFTVRETVTFYGKIAGMSDELINEKLEYLVKMLMLPSSKNKVGELSGGQQRRVSLAVALVHEPELLVLDEPTVGVDPVVRHSVWDHLLKLMREKQTTIIITTHYIEEARQAHCIGLMRGGRLLAEDAPDHLIQRYRTDSLEDVFLKLSVIQNRTKKDNDLDYLTGVEGPSGVINVAATLDEDIKSSVMDTDDVIEQFALPDMPPSENVPFRFWDYIVFLNFNHIRALVARNFLWIWRQWTILCFVLFLPIMQVTFFYLSIGHDPTELHIAVKNYELNSSKEICTITPGCNSSHLSCLYLKFLDEKQMIIDYYDTEDEAREAVRRGKAWAALVFQANYSESLRLRITEQRDFEDWSIDSSNIAIWQDKSNQQIAILQFRDYYIALYDFLQEFLKGCEISPKLGTIPVLFKDPVYGTRNPSLTDFAAPGVILTIVFFLALALTAGSLLIERNQGSLDRSLICGISPVELLLAHAITESIIMIGQAILTLLFSFYVFNLTHNGDIVSIGLMVILCGFCGMTCGLLIACYCETERSATYLTLGSFQPIIILSGIIWPLEGMHEVIRIIAYFLPLTYPTESLRSMLERGWSITESQVCYGFLIIVAWSVIYLLGSIIIIKTKRT